MADFMMIKVGHHMKRIVLYYERNKIFSALFYGICSYSVSLIVSAMIVCYTTICVVGYADNDNIVFWKVVIFGPIIETILFFLPVAMLLRLLSLFSVFVLRLFSIFTLFTIGYLVHGTDIWALPPASGFGVLGLYLGGLVRDKCSILELFGLLTFSHSIWNLTAISLSYLV